MRSGMSDGDNHVRCFLEVVGVYQADSIDFSSFLSILCSLRYHLLHPDYLYYRIRELQKNFKLRVVLCHVDVVSLPRFLKTFCLKMPFSEGNFCFL